MNGPTRGSHTEVTTTGTLSRIDAEAPRPLAYDEFVDFVNSIADQLHADRSLIDPSVSGQASTGEVEISFGVPISIGAPELSGRLSQIFDSLNGALGLIWPHDTVQRTRGRVTTMLNPTSQHLDGINEPALT